MSTKTKYSPEELIEHLKDNADRVRRTVGGESDLLANPWAGELADGSGWADVYEQAAEFIQDHSS